MFEGRDPSPEIVCEANRAFVVESGPIRSVIEWMEYIFGVKTLLFACYSCILYCIIRVPGSIMSLIF